MLFNLNELCVFKQIKQMLWPDALGTHQPSNPHLSRFRSNQRARINPERKGKRLNEG
jgi:hypothetical protein